MSPMFLQVGWSDLAVRFGLTVAACLLLGYDRSEHGKVAGMRTTMLVGVAAAVAMMQANILLATSGRQPDSFIMNDLMRLPLGILTGVGFIGGGTILRRGNIVVGVTTAANLWLITVIGLCFGGGQIALGICATVIGLLCLEALKLFETVLWHEGRSHLTLELDERGPTETQIRARLAQAGLAIRGMHMTVEPKHARRRLGYDVRDMRKGYAVSVPDLVRELESEPGILSIGWRAVA